MLLPKGPGEATNLSGCSEPSNLSAVLTVQAIRPQLFVSIFNTICFFLIHLCERIINNYT